MIKNTKRELKNKMMIQAFNEESLKLMKKLKKSRRSQKKQKKKRNRKRLMKDFRKAKSHEK